MYHEVCCICHFCKYEGEPRCETHKDCKQAVTEIAVKHAELIWMGWETKGRIQKAEWSWQHRGLVHIRGNT